MISSAEILSRNPSEEHQSVSDAEDEPKSSSTAWLVWSLWGLLLYILSPIPLLLPIGYWDSELELQLEETLYAPLVFLCEHSDVVSMFYEVQADGVEWLLTKLGG